jgi:hypothetical protein
MLTAQKNLKKRSYFFLFTVKSDKVKINSLIINRRKIQNFCIYTCAVFLYHVYVCYKQGKKFLIPNNRLIDV